MDFSKFYKAPVTFEAGGFKSLVPGIDAVFMAGPEYRGRQTRIFAWYGVPENRTTESVPGIVLVHGGLGTAFVNWVKRWNDRGFAAIAIDMFGGLPARDGAYCSKNPPERHDFSGPDPEKRYDDLFLPPEEQWPYHAAAAIISAASLLASLPGVDPDRIGLTGISWGGYAAALAAGYDERFRFVMPVYGCGGFASGLELIAQITPPGVSRERIEKFASMWDPVHTLANAKMPMLWVNGADDPCFDVFNWNRTAAAAHHSCRALRPTMKHAQADGESPLELEVFANTVLAGRKFPAFTEVEYDQTSQQLVGSWDSDVGITKAVIASTRAYGGWNDCRFRTAAAGLDQNNFTATGSLPADWSAAYLILSDTNGLIYTSEVLFNK